MVRRRSSSPPWPGARVLGALVFVALCWPTPGAAQALGTEIEAARAAIETSGLDEGARQAALANLDAAAAHEREAAALAERTAGLAAEAAEAPARMAQLQKSLERDPARALAAWEARLPADADAETLEGLLAQERRDAGAARAEMDAVGGDLAAALSRPAQAGDDIATLHRRIEDLQVPPVAQEGEAGPLFDARRLRRAAELTRVRAELALRTTEQDTAFVRQQLLALRLRELRHRLGAHETRIAVLQHRIAELGRRDLERRVERLAAQAEALETSDRVTATAAAENHALGRELLDHNERLRRERSALVAFEQGRERVQTTLRESLTRLELGGTSEQIGRWLWSERRRLGSPARLRQRLAELRNALADLRVRLVTLADEQRNLEDVAASARALREAGAGAGDDEIEDAPPDQTALEELLGERRELLALLAPLLQRRIATLEQGERALQAELEGAVELRQILDRRLLWIRSHSPVDLAWAARVPEGLRDLAKPSRLLTTTELLVRDVKARPARHLGSLLLLALALALVRRAPARIAELGGLARQIRKDRFRYTLETLGWTAAAALPWPLAAALFGLLLQGIGTPGRFSDSLGRTCVALALPLLGVTFLGWSSVERGLGHAHFRWTRQRREALRRWVPRVAAIVLPLAFVVRLAFIRNQDLAIDVSARIALVVMFGVAAWASWRLLDAGMLWSIRGADDARSTVRRALRLGLPAFLGASAVLALAGYVYSAAMLAGAVLDTFVVLVLVATVLGVAGRWFLIGERRLKVRRLEEQQAAEAQPAEDDGEALRQLEEDLTLEQVSAQTRRLLRAVRLAVLAFALVWVWSDVLLAFARLDEVALWHVTDVGPDGHPLDVPVTLMAVLLGVTALALTVIGARNLPGLVEIGLLSRTNVDAASRYAVTSVLRYGIVTAGTLAGLSLLGLRWSQLQWLAAALTVGLGFGLQEIFANFVSGLILLFERPFRVGDVITVGDLSGRVTRIRTRATTILDFENKEIVVPNKTFITGQLVNWTLSDTTTRVTVKIGVAYGTDPAAVHAVLREAARENPRVLTDPEATSWFLAFGASSLDFELRVYVGTLGDRLAVQDELNTRIAALCAERGIEIAFPQLDLHVRDLPARTQDG